MPKIKILPQNLANQIAAGEVVERPASVIKELLENSIDAGATKIQIEVELGGRRLIKIIDDGTGISRDDASLAFERHATSKLRSLTDLESITTLGFRGEALASISSVSRIELVSKTEEEEFATRVSTENGKDFEIIDTARTTGTTVTVRDLFHNTPARRKFLRSQPTENYHIASIVTHYALANPLISFVLTNNGRESIRVSPARTLKERAYQLFGNEIIESLVPVKGGTEFFVRVEGFVSAPRERRTSRDSQYFFINGRFVKDRVISSALSEGYRSVLPHGVYPVAFLFLELPPEEVDVNVHPSKTEVRFRRAEAVKDAVSLAVKSALSSAGIGNGASYGSAAAPRPEAATGPLDEYERPAHAIPAPEYPEPRPVKLDFETDVFDSAGDGPPEAGSNSRSEGSQFSGTAAARTPLEAETAAPQGYGILPPVDSAYSIPKPVDPSELDSGVIKPIGQLHNSFIIASDNEGLLLIDQHVAHERILFDYFRKKESERGVESQNLLIPELIELTPAQFEVFPEVYVQLKGYGFRVSVMSGNTIAVQAMPSDLAPGDAKNLFSEILETTNTTKYGDANASFKDSIAASLACKAAVKINMELTPEKMKWMIENLLLTSSPSTCPHGRPVVLRLTLKDIERRFHRT